MASQPQVSELSSAFESLRLNGDFSLILPFFLGFADSPRRTDLQGPDQENETRPTSPQRIIFFNPFAQHLIGISPLDSPFGDFGRRDGQPPASKASIEAMASVGIRETSECVICLEEMEIGGVAKEMPCNHKFHGHCIEKWLELHGWCPVCRYKMPADEENGNKKVDDEEREIRAERGIWVSFSFDSVRRSQDSNQPPSIDQNSTS